MNGVELREITAGGSFTSIHSSATLYNLRRQNQPDLLTVPPYPPSKQCISETKTGKKPYSHPIENEVLILAKKKRL